MILQETERKFMFMIIALKLLVGGVIQGNQIKNQNNIY